MAFLQVPASAGAGGRPSDQAAHAAKMKERMFDAKALILRLVPVDVMNPDGSEVRIRYMTNEFAPKGTKEDVAKGVFRARAQEYDRNRLALEAWNLVRFALCAVIRINFCTPNLDFLACDQSPRPLETISAMVFEARQIDDRRV